MNCAALVNSASKQGLKPWNCVNVRMFTNVTKRENGKVNIARTQTHTHTCANVRMYIGLQTSQRGRMGRSTFACTQTNSHTRKHFGQGQRTDANAEPMQGCMCVCMHVHMRVYKIVRICICVCVKHTNTKNTNTHIRGGQLTDWIPAAAVPKKGPCVAVWVQASAQHLHPCHDIWSNSVCMCEFGMIHGIWR